MVHLCQLGESSKYFLAKFSVILKNLFYKDWLAIITTKFLIISIDDGIIITMVSRINKKLLCELTNWFISFLFKKKIETSVSFGDSSPYHLLILSMAQLDFWESILNRQLEQVQIVNG